MNRLIHASKNLPSRVAGLSPFLSMIATLILAACQSAPKSESTRQQTSDLIHEAEGSGTIVLVVIALIVAWMILLGFVGRITKIKNS